MAETTEVTLTRMEASGAAAGRAGSEPVLVPGGIPGERVRIRRVRPLAHATLCEVVDVVEPSPHRISPRCRHATACGGCAWQHLAYGEQLRTKTRMVEALLKRTLGDQAPPVSAAIGTPSSADGMPWGFRQKAAFVFAPARDGTLAMGHFARGTHAVVPVVECPVHPERANRIAFALRDELRNGRVPAAGEDLAGLARHVLVRTSGDAREAVAVLVATRSDPRLDEALQRLLRREERPDGLSLNLHDRPGPYLLGRETRRVDGPGHVREDALGCVFLVSATAFFQTNVAAAATLTRLVTEACERGGPAPRRVLDLYSGSGLFALPLAMRGHAVVAVEESRKGMRDAELNRRTNGSAADGLRLVAGSAEAALPRIEPAEAHAVVLDPPRDGASPRVLQQVFGRLRPERVILVSCNPAALARELSAGRRAGYRAEHVQPVDMFPHTAHVETVTVLVRGSRARARRPEARQPRR